MNYENMSDEELLEPDVPDDYSKMSDEELLKPDVSDSYRNMSDEELLKPDDAYKSPYEQSIESARKRKNELISQRNRGFAMTPGANMAAYGELDDINKKLAWADTEKADDLTKTISWGNGVSMKDGETYDDGNGEYYRFDYEKAKRGEDPRIPVSSGEYDKTHYDYAKDYVDDGMSRKEMTNTDILKAKKHRDEKRAKAQQDAKDALAHYVDRFGKAKGKVTFGAEELAADEIDENDADAQSAKQSLDDHGRNISHDRPMHFDRDENGKITGYGTTRSMVMEEFDGTYSVIPTIRGEQGHTIEMTPEEAVAWYRKTQANDKKHEPGKREGERWGNYDNLDDAERASKDVSALHRKMYQNKWNQYIREHWDEMADSVKNAPGVKEDYDAWVKAGSPRVEVDLEELRKNRETGDADKPKAARTILEDVQANYQAETGEDVSKAYAALHNIIPFLKTSDKIDAASEQARLEKQLDESYRKGDWAKNMEARYELEEHARIKDKARQFLDKTYLPWYKKPVAGGIENTGYTLEYVLAAGVGSVLGAAVKGAQAVGTVANAAKTAGMVGAKAMDVAIPAATAAYSRFGDLTANDYGVDENGDLVMSVEGDEKSAAATKAIIGGIAEAVIEKYLFDNPATKALGKTAVARQIRGKFMESVAKSKIGNAWLKTVEGFNKLGKFTAQQGTEVLEEDAQAIVDDVLGMGRRADEAYNGSDTLTWKGQLDILLNMLGTMGAQGAVGYAMESMGERARNKAHRAEAKTIYDIPGLDKQLVDNMSDYEKAKFVGFYNKYSGNADKLNEVADRLFGVNGKIELALRNAAQRNNVEMDRALEERGVTPENFVIPTDENGNVAFTPKQITDPIKGTLGVYPVAEDNAHGVSIVDVGSGRAFVVMDQYRGEYYGFNDLDSAKTFADGIVKLNQKKDLDNRVKVEYATELAQKNNVNVDVVESLVQLKQMVGDRDAQQMYASGVPSFVANGKVMLILDNCKTPSDMDHTIARMSGIAQRQENGEVNHVENAFIELDVPPEAPVREVTTGPAAPETDENADFGDEEAALDAAQGENVATTIENAPKTPVEASEGAGQENVPTEAETPQKGVVEEKGEGVEDVSVVQAETKSEPVVSKTETAQTATTEEKSEVPTAKENLVVEPSKTDREPSKTDDGIPTVDTLPTEEVSNGKKGKRAKSKTWAVGNVGDRARLADGSVYKIYTTEGGRKKWKCVESATRNGKSGVKLGQHFTNPDDANVETVKTEGELGEHQDWKVDYIDGDGREVTLKPANTEAWTESHKFTRPSISGLSGDAVADLVDTTLSDKRYDAEGLQDAINWASNLLGKRNKSATMGAIAWGKGKNVLGAGPLRKRIDAAVAKAQQRKDALTKANINKRNKRLANISIDKGVISSYVKKNPDSLLAAWMEDVGETNPEKIRKILNGESDTVFGERVGLDELVEMAKFMPRDINNDSINHLELPNLAEQIIAEMDKAERTFKKDDDYEAYLRDQKEAQDADEQAVVQQLIEDKALYDAARWSEDGNNVIMSDGTALTVKKLENGDLEATDKDNGETFVVYADEPNYEELFNEEDRPADTGTAALGGEKDVPGARGWNREETAGAEPVPGRGRRAGSPKRNASAYRGLVSRNATPEEIAARDEVLKNGGAVTLLDPEWFAQDDSVKNIVIPKLKIESDADAAALIQDYLYDPGKEKAKALYIYEGTYGDIGVIKVVGIGNVGMTTSGIDEVVAGVFPGCKKVIYSHNHISGDVTRTDADVKVTENLRNAMFRAHPEVSVDHIITDTDRFYSFNSGNVTLAEIVPDNGARAVPYKDRTTASKGEIERICNSLSSVQNENATWLIGMGAHDEIYGMVALPVDGDFKRALAVIPGARRFAVAIGKTPFDRRAFLDELDTVGKDQHGRPLRKITYIVENGEATEFYADNQDAARSAFLNEKKEASVVRNETDAQQANREYFDKLGDIDGVHFTRAGDMVWLHGYDRKKIVKDELKKHGFKWGAFKGRDGQWHGIQAFGIAYGDIPQSSTLLGKIDETEGATHAALDADQKAYAERKGKTVEQRKAEKLAEAASVAEQRREGYKQTQEQVESDNSALDDIDLDNLAEDETEVSPTWDGGGVKRRKEEIDAAVDFALNGDPVSIITGKEFPQTGNNDLVDRVSAFYASIGGSVENDELGTVLLDRRSVKSSLGHGIGREKAAAFAAVPDVINKGKIFDRQIDRKGNGIGSVVIAAPIKIGYENYVCEAIVESYGNGKERRFYLHEVNLQSLLSDTIKTPTGGASIGKPSRPVRSILAKLARESQQWNLAEGETEISRPTTAMDKVFAVGVRRASNFLANGIGTKFADFVRYADETFGDKAAKLRKFYPTWYLEAGIDMGEAVRDQMDDSIAVDRMAREMFGLSPRGKDKPGQRVAYVVQEHLLPSVEQKVNAESYNRGLDADQQLGVNLALNAIEKPDGSFMLADGTGFGKTRQILAIADQYKKSRARARVLILTKSQNIIADSFAKDSASMGIDMGQFTVGTYDGLRAGKFTPVKDGLGLSEEWDLVILDEAHKLANSDSATTQEYANLPVKHTVFATATPMDRTTDAAYFMAKLNNSDPQTIARSLGYQLVTLRNRQGKEYVSAVPINGMDEYSIQRAIIMERDKAIASGKMIRRAYPFLGDVVTQKVGQGESYAENEAAIITHFDEEIRALRNAKKIWMAKDRKYYFKGGVPRGQFGIAVNPNEWDGIVSRRKKELQDEKTKAYDALCESDKAANAVRLAVDILKNHPGAKVIICGTQVNEQHIGGGFADSRNELKLSGVRRDVLGKKVVYAVESSMNVAEKTLNNAGITRVSHIYGRYKKDVEQALFNNGTNNVLLMTDKSGGTGINLDDTTGEHPTYLLVLSPNYSAKEIDQLMGRVSRKNTKSLAHVLFLTNDSISDTHRANVTQKKLGVLKAIQGGADADALLPMVNESDAATDGTMLAEGEDEAPSRSQMTENDITKAILDSTLLDPLAKQYSGYTDKALVEKALDDDVLAFNALYRKYMKPSGLPGIVRRVANKYGATVNDAMIDAITSDVWSHPTRGVIAELRTKPETYRTYAFSTILFSKAGNFFKDNLNALKRQGALTLDQPSMSRRNTDDIDQMTADSPDAATAFTGGRVASETRGDTIGVRRRQDARDRIQDIILQLNDDDARMFKEVYAYELSRGDRPKGSSDKITDEEGRKIAAKAKKPYGVFVSEWRDLMKKIRTNEIDTLGYLVGDVEGSRYSPVELIDMMREQDLNDMADVVELREKGMNYTQIAKELDMEENAVRTQISRAHRDFDYRPSMSMAPSGTAVQGEFYLDDNEVFVERKKPTAKKKAASPYSQDTLFEGEREITPEEDAAYREVWNRYHNADGTAKPGWLKAPNGKPSKLSEKLWMMVRTPSFKKWFGDWERLLRIRKLRNYDSIEYKWNRDYELNRHSARSWALQNLRKEYINDDTGDTIGTFRDELRKVTSHGTHDEAHLKSIAAIPKIIKSSIFIDERPNTKNKHDYDSFRYYVAGINIDGVPYTVKVVVGVKDGNKYYDHDLTKIEKGTLVDRLSNLPGAAKENPLDAGYDTKLYDLLQVGEVSNVVDENGEPLEVYHGSRIFNPLTDGGVFKDVYNRGNEFYFTPNKETAKAYAGFVDAFGRPSSKTTDKSNVGSYFLNLREDSNGNFIDGWWNGWEIIVKKPSQIKSADPVTYDDAGNVIPLSERFNPEKDSVLYEDETEVGMGMDNASREDFFKSHKIEAFAKRKGRTVEDLQKKLNREISNYENARRQIDDMAASGKFAPTDDQQVLIGWFLKEARDEFDADWQGQMAAEANGDEALAKDYARKMENVRPWLMKLERLNDRLGSEWGRAGRARQLRIMQDYSLANQIVQAEKQAGRALTKEEIDQLRPLCERLRESGIELDAAKMEQLDFMMKSLVDSWINGEKRRVDVDRKLGKSEKKIEMEYETALRQMAFYKDRVITVIPDVKKWLNAIVRHHLLVGDIYQEDGKVDEPKAVEAVIRDVGEQGVMATDWQVRQILTDMGKSTVPPQNKLERDRRELNTQMLIEHQMAYMLKHGEMPPVTGYMRDIQSMAVRELRKRRDAVIKEMGLNADKEEGRLKSALDRAKRNVMNRIEEIRAAIAKGERIPKEKRTPNQDAELLALKADLKHEKELYDTAFPKTEEELFEATVRRTLGALKASGNYWKNRLDNARNGIFDKDDKTPVSTPEIEAMRKANKAMKDEFEALKEAAFPEGTPKEIERKCDAREKHLLAQIEKKDEQIRAYENASTFEERRKALEKDTRKDKLMTPEIAALDAEDKKRREKIEEFKRNLRKEDSPLMDKVLRNADDFMSVPRILRTILDDSAVFTQAGAYSLGSPIEAAKALGKSLQAVSEKHGDVINQMLRNDLYFDDFVKMGGHVYGNVEGVPEAFRGMNRFVGRMPVIRAIAGASERAFATYLNVFAISQYKALVNSPAFGSGGPSEVQRKRLAAFVNTALGYGYVSKGKRATAVADFALWAPRLMAASVKTAFAYDVWGQAFGDRKSEYGAKERFQTARVIGSKWAKAMAAGAALQVLMNLFWADDDEDKWDTFKDLTSGDFMTAKQGKIHFTGAMGRYTRWWQLFAMALAGVKDGKRFDLDSAAWRKLSGAFQPSLALVWDLVRRRDFVGNEIDWGKFSPKGKDEKVVGALPHIFEGTVVSLFIADQYDSLMQNGVGKTAAMAIPMFLGMGVKTYDNDKLKAVDESTKRYLNTMEEKAREADDFGDAELKKRIEEEAKGKVGKGTVRRKEYEKALGVLKKERQLESINKQLRGLASSAKSYEKLVELRDKLKEELERKNPETGKTLREDAEESARKLKWHSPTSWEE